MAATSVIPAPYNAALILSSGEIFFGRGLGARGTALGELCFNTAMTGYQETLSDPSYSGQLICFTAPHIGNIGVNAQDMESAKVSVAGLILREAPTPPSNYRSEDTLRNWLKSQKINGIYGIDTRALTRHIRIKGAQNAAIYFPSSKTEPNLQEAIDKLAAHPAMQGLDLTREVSTRSRYEWSEPAWQEQAANTGTHPHIVAIDYGEKLNILRRLVSEGFRVTVVPATATAKDILALKPDGVFLSNGPGDPQATSQHSTPLLRQLMQEKIPIFGICLGHQLLALAVGAQTEKMFQGHRGVNQPVKDLATGKIEITSQNHGFVVQHGSLPPEAEVTHISLFDGSIEGFRMKDRPAFAVQYHPESSPGPHDSRYLFRRFKEMVDAQTH